MPTCAACGDPPNLPRECSYCGATVCAEHHLPEHHNCDMTGADTASATDTDSGPEPIEPETVGSAPKTEPPTPPEVSVKKDRTLRDRVRELVSRLF